ncbi:MAG: ATP synthase F1 subunit gamma [Verrucomicrobia bacterium]|nr:ATP synthase F1 subunit gamma [Verrucomicrobiota bacterium]
MANTQDIRRRIKSVSNTAQITNAMQLVAASKMKKAQDFATSGRPFAEVLNSVLVNLKANTEDEAHPLLEEREGNKTLVVVITTDKGLCGGLNTNLLRKVDHEGDDETAYVTVGRKGRQALARLKKNLVADFEVSDPAEFAEAKLVAKFVMDKFLEGEYDRVQVAFTRFVSTLSQEPAIETLLPIRSIDLGVDKGSLVTEAESVSVEADKTEDVGGDDYIFEPDPATVLDSVVPYYVNFTVFQMMQESRASEHSARMVAMKSATDNANDMIKDLKLEYNKIRQAAITTELLDITTAMKALD